MGRAAGKTARRAGRRWRVPPAMTRDPGDLLEGVNVLREHPSELGALLWQAGRDVAMWGEAPAAARARLFAPGAYADRMQALQRAAVDPDVSVWLHALAQGVLLEREHADAAHLARACVRIARWAFARGHGETALHFAQAAALADVDAPLPALETGRIAVALGKVRRGETWLHRAIALARRAKDWETYGLAYVELAGASEARADAARARQYHVRAARMAKRHGLTLVRGAAAHGLLRAATAAREFGPAQRYARLAQRCFAGGHPHLPELLLDVAALRLRAGEFRAASDLLRPLALEVTDPPRRMYALALLAHAAAGQGATGALAEAWTSARELADRHPGAPLRVPALVELARAARLAGDARRAEQAASAARDAVRGPADAAAVASLRDEAGPPLGSGSGEAA